MLVVNANNNKCDDDSTRCRISGTSTDACIPTSIVNGIGGLCEANKN